VGSAGRYGPRYGTRTKKIVAVMESQQNKGQVCPYCERPALKRLAAGIWKCIKCGKKFAGGAYFPQSVVAAEALAAARRVEGLKTQEKKAESGR
jgi:large subunit ribosomal protein L37Ae